jgi:hypothetical protein
MEIGDERVKLRIGLAAEGRFDACLERLDAKFVSREALCELGDHPLPAIANR